MRGFWDLGYGQRRLSEALQALTRNLQTSLAIGLVATIDAVIVLRGVQGAFGALLLPNTLALLKAAFPAERAAAE